MTSGERADPPTVDVLIVTHNGREVVRECLESLRAHAPDPDRVRVAVHVLDNASTDGTPAMIARDFPEVSLDRAEENLGFARANNRLAGASSADHLLLLNPDVVLTEDVVEPLLERLRREPRVAVVGPRLVHRDGRTQYSAPRFPGLAYEYAVALRGTRLGRLVRPVFDSERRVAEVERHGDDADERDRHADTLWATCWLLRRSDVERHGLFDEAFSMYDEDLDFCRRLSGRGGVALYCPSLSVVHVGGVSSSLPERHAMLRRARRRYYRRHGGPAIGAAYVAGLRLIAAADRAAAAVPSPRRRRAEAPS